MKPHHQETDRNREANTGGSRCPKSDTMNAALRGELDDLATAELLAHAETCVACANQLAESPAEAALEDDVRWVDELWKITPVDINVPIARLNQFLPNYEILGEIGRGGMGIVFEARDLALDRRIAIKVLPALLGAVRPEALVRFRREAALAAKLEHTHIISVYDFGEVDGTCYYAMQLIAGRSLRALLREVQETGVIDVVLGRGDAHDCAATSDRTRLGSSSQTDSAYFRQVATWIADAAEAAHYAHDRGVIHRDLKPANLLLTDDHQIIVSDFGLARRATDESLTRSSAVIGTIRYASPEQVQGDEKAIDRRVDVYALGATLYETLTLRPLFADCDDRELLARVMNDEPPPPRRLMSQVPRELETICLKAIDKNREQRYDTAQALADDLRRFLLDLPILARRASISERTLRFVRRKKAISILTCTVAILVALTGFYSAGYRSWRNEAQTAQTTARKQELRILDFEGQAAYDNGDFEGTLEKIEAALTKDPENLTLQCARGRFLYKVGRSDEAIAYLEVVSQQNPNCSLPHSFLAGFLQDPERSEYHRRRSLELLPESKKDTTLGFIMRAEAESDPARALEILDEAIKTLPPDIGLIMARYERLIELKQFERAMQDAERAAAIRPLWAHTHAMRGEALSKLGRYEESLRAYTRAIELDDKNMAYWANRAHSHNKLHQFTHALLDAEQAVSMEASQGVSNVAAHARLLLARATAKAGLNDIEGAHADLNLAMDLNPNDPEVFFQRSLLLTEPNERIIAATIGIELAPEDTRIYQNRAVDYYLIGDIDAAIRDRSKVIEFSPTPLNHHLRAITYLEAQMVEDAITDLTTVLESEPRNWLARQRRGMAYEIVNEPQRAIEDYNRVIALAVPASDYAALLSRIAMHELEPKTGDFESNVVLERVDKADDTQIARLVEFFTDRLTASQVLNGARNDLERAEAYYYIGRKELTANDIDAARAAWQTSVRLDPNRQVVETVFAMLMLSHL